MSDDQPIDLGHDAEAEPPDLVGPAARRFRRRLIAAGGIIAVIALLAGMALAPGAVRSGGGRHGVSADVGHAVYSGLAGSRDPIQLLWVQPAASDGLDAEVLVCRDTPNGGVGLVGDADIAETCGELEPAGFGVRVGAQAPHGTAHEHLVVRLTPTREGNHALCGVRVLYRAGLRIGFTRLAGPATYIDSPRLPEGQFVDFDAKHEPC